MMKHKKLSMAVAGACALMASTGASAIDFTKGDWTMDINGTVNGFYTNSSCDSVTKPAITGAIACGGVGSNGNATNIQNGLLPGWINFVATTRQNNLDIKAHIGFAPGINSGTAVPGTAFVPTDTRNVYLSFGDKSWGNIKVGRDIGLFGSNAILSDMTLLGVGGFAAQGVGFVNTTFGMIGNGYLYTAFQPQITYTTPDAGGLQGSIGMFQPVNPTPALNKLDAPGLQALGSYSWSGQASGKVWLGFVNQRASSTTAGVSSVTPNAWEIGGKAGAAGFEGMLYYYKGNGIGTTLLFNAGLDAANNKRNSDGYLAQVTYKFGDTKLGLNYGRSKLDNTGAADLAANPALIRENKAWTLGVYHNLTKSLQLVGEYVDNKSSAQNSTVAGDLKSNTFAVGAILFF